MTVFALRLPAELKEKAAEQAVEAGVSLNQYIAVAVAARVGAQAEAERYFRTRGTRAAPGRAKAILARAGVGNPPREEDAI
ncbi:MAG TPA: toxin-antitoxin system HicB family antitoxin [Stellaceae bacterium]|nr:toxin-antitoxin system HicB family antitoxin [Stellaceae bacterium]